ncbi:DUF799 domain-containing protein [Pseudomonas alabamensis]|jgi:hypothetical protein|uniref:DUF799 domain-containing protein n=1 Tax=Pseudomonas alabamensis TaxID=3064349 RepID=UPI003F64A450
MIARVTSLIAALCALTLLAGCVQRQTVDYSAYKQSRPKSILILPPLNESPDVKATYSMLSQATYPLAEAGYYVMPVALVDETFRQNGMTTAADIQQLPMNKLHEIFGADAGLYVTVSDYGTRYMVLSSATIVTAQAKLIDLKTGTTLWTGHATASSQENQQGQGDLISLLIMAAVNQIVSSVQEDAGYPIAGMTSARLLTPNPNGGLLYGPRSPKYGTD